jgi:hypothetical protein
MVDYWIFLLTEAVEDKILMKMLTSSQGVFAVWYLI